MSEILNDKNKEAIKQLLSQDKISILIVEDHLISQDGLKVMFESAFPNSVIDIYKGFGKDERPLENLIKEGKPNIISTDGSLSDWDSHGLFGKDGAKIVEFARGHSENSFIISISFEPGRNIEAIDKGAHLAVDKTKLIDFLKEVKKLH